MAFAIVYVVWGSTYLAIRFAIETLPPHEREVLVLKEFEGLRYREIAALLNIPIGTVMSRLYSARQIGRAHV